MGLKIVCRPRRRRPAPLTRDPRRVRACRRGQRDPRRAIETQRPASRAIPAASSGSAPRTRAASSTTNDPPASLVRAQSARQPCERVPPHPALGVRQPARHGRHRHRPATRRSRPPPLPADKNRISTSRSCAAQPTSARRTSRARHRPVSTVRRRVARRGDCRASSSGRSSSRAPRSRRWHCVRTRRRIQPGNAAGSRSCSSIAKRAGTRPAPHLRRGPYRAALRRRRRPPNPRNGERSPRTPDGARAGAPASRASSISGPGVGFVFAIAPRERTTRIRAVLARSSPAKAGPRRRRAWPCLRSSRR